MNEEDPLAGQLMRHMTAVSNAQTCACVPLRSLLSPDSGRSVTESDAENIAFLMEDARALSKLRFTLKVNKYDIVTLSDVAVKAFGVINKWRQSTSHSFISVLRDALHRSGLSEIDRHVFGHIVDQTLAEPALLPETADVQRKMSSYLETGYRSMKNTSCIDDLGYNAPLSQSGELKNDAKGIHKEHLESSIVHHGATSTGEDSHSLSFTGCHPNPSDLQDDFDLNSPITCREIQHVSECKRITQHWLKMGWLMLSDSGYTLDQIRNHLMKDRLNLPDSAKVVHLIEQWQLLSNEVTVRDLVDICCHETIGGIRDVIVNVLKFGCGSGSGK
jgi:hypothetical protein